MGIPLEVRLDWAGRRRVRRRGGFHAPERLDALLESVGADILLVSSPDNVAYLSNFDTCAARIISSPVIALVARQRRESTYLIFPIYELPDYVECASPDVKAWCYSVGRFRYFTDIAGSRESLGSELERSVSLLAEEVPCSEQAFDALSGALASMGLTPGTCVAVEDGGLSFAFRRQLHHLLTGSRLVDGEEVMRKLRAKKSALEIRLLEQASAINNRAMAKATAEIRQGVTEAELAHIFSESVWSEGAEVSWAVIKGGVGAAFTHAHSTDYALRSGDLVRLELGCIYSGYYSDVGRTYVVGKASKEQAAIYSGLRAGFLGAMGALRPGARACDVFRAGLEAVHAAGFRSYQRGFIGHGCGTLLYDPPLVTQSSEEEIEADMVLATELPYYRLGFGGMQLEAQVVVEQGGARVLGDIPVGLELSR